MEEYDYVIVGAGSAGSVLAEALSRDGKSTVAIIEAGGSDRRFFVQMPLGYGKTFFDKTINWNYQAEPDPGLNGQSDFWPRGKIVGGSGSINAMVWIRGDSRDYDDWAAEGNPGWSHADVLPYFKGLEDNQAGADEWRGQGGPVHITDASRHAHPLAQRFVKAATEAGFAFNPDFNGATQEGVGIYQINSKNGWRMSAAKAFLRPALRRKNVRLYLHSHALKVTFDGNRASGMEMLRAGQRQMIRARREVILAGGAVNSPQLLQLSGIGPAEHLKSLGIEVLADNPAVGHHMQDHLGINYVFKASIPTLNQVLRPWWGKLRAGLEFLLAGGGPLSLSMNQGGGFVKSHPDLERPDTQLYFQAISTFSAKKGTRPLLVPDPFPGFAIGISNTRPTARGTCLIRSADPFVAPAIVANAYGTANDVQDMLASVKVIRRIAAQPALRDIIVEELQPGASVTTDEALIDDFRNRSGTVYHPCGTARMGSNAGNSAVDGRLRVRGVAGLRVADASVFPSVISGNTNAPAMMVAAKAAAMILEDRET
ncbi:GMC family oxidoreductase N-terminal domain-containing protein [Rhizobium sp. KVB221]|uniref:GMC family oxidoreductase N-terminal domain-containing protein n=1 Tax=Rhizobium setariae TaxID=2801340 RepID=A0A936YP29_9HYPH|nr:GMC family oxidoreductase N-terminal domain-containing protein [Rhizobium setariae]